MNPSFGEKAPGQDLRSPSILARKIKYVHLVILKKFRESSSNCITRNFNPVPGEISICTR